LILSANVQIRTIIIEKALRNYSKGFKISGLCY
jgi:hypothetical protein